MNFPERFERILQEQKLILPGEKIWIACSGGPDSVALFHLLCSLRRKWRLRLGLIHFNHGLRGNEAGQDVRFVRSLAKKNRLPFCTARGKIQSLARKDRLSLEEAARKARYDFFVETARRYRIPKMALAHTQNDQAETVLMRILQGTGLRGLLGIRSKIKMGSVIFIRPLLEFSKEEIRNFLEAKQIPYREDSSNRSLQFLRNRIRRRLLPRLAREFNPRIVQTLARIPAIVREEHELFQELETKAWKRIFKTADSRKVELKRRYFLKCLPPLQFRILERALRKLDFQSGLGFDAWKRLRPELTRAKFRVSLPRDIDLELTPSKISIYKKFTNAGQE